MSIVRNPRAIAIALIMALAAACFGAEAGSAWAGTGTIAFGTKPTATGRGVVLSGATATIVAGGDYTASGTSASGQIRIDTKESVRLRLAGLDLSNPTGAALWVANAKKVVIELAQGSSNRLTDGATTKDEVKAALFSNDDLEIGGSGSLTVTGRRQHGIAADDDLVVSGGTLVVTAPVDALHANGDIELRGGKLNLTAGSDGAESEAELLVAGATVVVSAADDGLHAEGNLAVSSGSVEVAKSFEGIEAKGVLTIGGGSVRVLAEDDALNAGSELIVNGGSLFAYCRGDGLDSNGSMTINGGYSVVYSGNNANGPVDIGDRAGTLIVNGGTLLATGGFMGVSVSTSSKQGSLWIGASLAAGAVVNISAADRTSLATFAPPQSASLVFFTSPKLKTGTAYSVSAGGTAAGKAVDGVYAGGYSGGQSLGSVSLSGVSASIGQVGGGFGGGRGGAGGPGARPGLGGGRS